MRKGKVAGTRSPRKGKRQELWPLRSHVAGIDIGSRQMHVCAPTGEEGQIEVRVFGTATDEILACAQWLKQMQVESVAMERTGVYWIPVLEILEGCGLATLLADPRRTRRGACQGAWTRGTCGCTTQSAMRRGSRVCESGAPW